MEHTDLTATRRSSLVLLMRNLVSEESLDRSELIQRTQLSRAAVDQALNTLIGIGLVEDAGYGESTGGRRPRMVRLASRAAFTLGAAMSDFTWTMSLTDLHGQSVAEEQVDMHGGDPGDAVDALAEAHRRMQPALKDRRIPPVIGLGAPGLIDTGSGFIHSSVNLGWQDIPFGDLVSERLGMDVMVANRSKTSALAEAWLSDDGRIPDLIYIHLGLGVPAGIVMNGELVTGHHSFAGELGHFMLIPDGPSCPCGNRGCLQTLISEDAVRHRAMTMVDREASHPRELSAETILREADQGNPVYARVVREIAGYLAMAVGNLINLLDPEQIVLGGPMIRWSQLLLEETREQVAFRAMRLPLSLTRIQAASLGSHAGSRGAALMVRPQALGMILSQK